MDLFRLRLFELGSLEVIELVGVLINGVNAFDQVLKILLQYRAISHLLLDVSRRFNIARVICEFSLIIQNV